MRRITQGELNEIVRKHELWLRDESGGEKARLSGCDLRDCSLFYADLRDADLRGADLDEVSAAQLRADRLDHADKLEGQS